MEIVKTETVIENNTEYIIDTYENGAVAKYIKPTPVEDLPIIPPEPTLEERVSELQDNQLVMMDVMATSYEKETELSDNQLMIMDAIATLFEMQVH